MGMCPQISLGRRKGPCGLCLYRRLTEVPGGLYMQGGSCCHVAHVCKGLSDLLGEDERA